MSAPPPPQITRTSLCLLNFSLVFNNWDQNGFTLILGATNYTYRCKFHRSKQCFSFISSTYEKLCTASPQPCIPCCHGVFSSCFIACAAAKTRSFLTQGRKRVQAHCGLHKETFPRRFTRRQPQTSATTQQAFEATAQMGRFNNQR